MNDLFQETMWPWIGLLGGLAIMWVIALYIMSQVEEIRSVVRWSASVVTLIGMGSMMWYTFKFGMLNSNHTSPNTEVTNSRAEALLNKPSASGPTVKMGNEIKQQEQQSQEKNK